MNESGGIDDYKAKLVVRNILLIKDAYKSC